jgi:hypothetical protein
MHMQCPLQCGDSKFSVVTQPATVQSFNNHEAWSCCPQWRCFAQWVSFSSGNHNLRLILGIACLVHIIHVWHDDLYMY